MAAKIVRKQWGVPDDAPVIGFVGRFVRDKGIVELVDAFEQSVGYPPRCLADARWAITKPAILCPTNTSAASPEHRAFTRPGFVQLPQDSGLVDWCDDGFCFPHTSGRVLATSPLKQALRGLPVVTFQATGADRCRSRRGDGYGCPARAIPMLLPRQFCGISTTIGLRLKHGQAGHQRALTDFRPEPIWQAMDAHFRELLAERAKR